MMTSSDLRKSDTKSNSQSRSSVSNRSTCNNSSDSDETVSENSYSDAYEEDESENSEVSDSDGSNDSNEDEGTEIPMTVERQISVNTESSGSPLSQKAKKRKLHVKRWKKVKAKRRKNSGKSYISSTGKKVDEKEMKPACQDKCKLKCKEKFSEDSRRQLFEDYWKMADLQRQRDFLSSSIDKLNVKYPRVKDSSNRLPNCSFHIVNNGQRLRVCKTFLVNTLGISSRIIRTVIQCKNSGSGIIAEDQRGKHGNQKKIDGEILNSVYEHINSIPRVESHYTRSDSKREFIDGGLTVAEMHRNYSAQRSADGKRAANYQKYIEIFTTKFNIGFFLPRKDQCDLCEGYKNASDDEKLNLEEKYQTHLEEKELSRIEKDEDKQKANRKEIALAVYDLQAILPVPVGKSSAFFYKSRLNCYNFTISEIKEDKTFCYFWHEGLGGRGAVEIGSCVLVYLRDLAKKNPKIDVVFYSDNCGGQQKNKFVLSMYLYAVQYFDINSITHKYLVRGHTQNEGDTAHSIIERTVQRAKISGPIYVPDQYVSLIRGAKKNGNPFCVTEMSFCDFYDLKDLHNQMAPKIGKNCRGEEFEITEARVLRFEMKCDSFYYKTSYNQTDWYSVKFRSTSMRTRNSKGDGSRKEINLKPAHTNKLPLSENKKKDLMSLLKDNIIPRFYEPFYTYLFE